MTKLVSYALRSGMDQTEGVKAFSGIVCSYGRETCLRTVAELKDARRPSSPHPPTLEPHVNNVSTLLLNL